jgi:hypothetical protein
MIFSCWISHTHKDCCLDVDWLDDYTFASCGADSLIHIMQLGQKLPIKTFVCVCCVTCGLFPLPHPIIII